MRALDSGDAFLVTRNGVAVDELTPIRRRRFVARDALPCSLSAIGRSLLAQSGTFCLSEMAL